MGVDDHNYNGSGSDGMEMYGASNGLKENGGRNEEKKYL